MNKSKKEVWCEHIIWDKKSSDWTTWLFSIKIYKDEALLFCPICGAQRPGGKHGTK